MDKIVLYTSFYITSVRDHDNTPLVYKNLINALEQLNTCPAFDNKFDTNIPMDSFANSRYFMELVSKPVYESALKAELQKQLEQVNIDLSNLKAKRRDLQNQILNYLN